MSRVHVYVHGRGRGHGRRVRLITDHLGAVGYDARVFAGDDALSAFEPSHAEAIDSLRPGQGLSTLRVLRRRVRAALREIERDPPAALISDGDLPGALAASLRGLPSLALGHGLIFSHTERPMGIPAGRWRREAIKARAASMGSQKQVAVSFAPLTPRHATTTVARVDLRASLRGPRSRGTRVLCYFRDSNAESLLRLVVRCGAEVDLFAPRDPRIEGVTWRAMAQADFDDALLHAGAVISSAGSQLISECIALGLPQLALYRRDDHEQALNVAMLKHFGLGAGCAFEEVDEARVLTFLKGVESEATPSKGPLDLPEASRAVERALNALIASHE